jgi:hypothetical protein
MRLLHVACRDGWWWWWWLVVHGIKCCTVLCTHDCPHASAQAERGNHTQSLSATRLPTPQQVVRQPLFSTTCRTAQALPPQNDQEHSQLRPIRTACAPTHTRKTRTPRDVATRLKHTASAALRLLPNLSPVQHAPQTDRQTHRQGFQAKQTKGHAVCHTQVLALRCRAFQPKLQPRLRCRQVRVLCSNEGSVPQEGPARCVVQSSSQSRKLQGPKTRRGQPLQLPPAPQRAITTQWRTPADRHNTRQAAMCQAVKCVRQ